jgi:group II intron reverse transcriptase/maturase
VVDADLSDYFSSIPHGQLMKCISRRIVDKQLLAVIKQWLEMPVIEKTDSGNRCTTEAKDKHRGTPQGSPCSPLFSNIYFRRFILAWHKFGYAEDLDARVVNYADDFVICTKPGNGEQVMKNMHYIMSRIGLQVNESKTRLASLPEDSFDFLGYTIGRSYTFGGKSFIGSKPSKKSVLRVMKKIHEETSVRWVSTTAEKRVTELNQIVRGWANYFNQGPVLKAYKKIQRYMDRRLQLWLVRKHKQKGRGYRQYPEQFLYEKLGLIKLPKTRAELSRAKA